MTDIENNKVKKSSKLTKATPVVSSSQSGSVTSLSDRDSTTDKLTLKSRVIVVLKSWDDAPLGKFGTYCSFFILICGIVASILGQRYAPETINTPTPYSATNLSKEQWIIDCPAGYEDVCIGNGAVYRFSFALVIVFFIQLIGTTIWTKFFDNLWWLKCLVFACVSIGFFYANGNAFDANGYAWFARIAAFFYLIIQQVILLDFAFTWNDNLVTKAEEHGGNKWFIIIVVVSVLLFATSYAAMGIMFWKFMGCGSNLVILSLTVVFPTIATLIQLFVSDNASLLTSSVMTAYATYVCYSAVTLNPDQTCNPTISTRYQTVATVIGMILTVISLLWTTATVSK